MVTRSQVLRAEMREAAERTQPAMARAQAPARTAAVEVSDAQLLKVGLSSAR